MFHVKRGQGAEAGHGAAAARYGMAMFHVKRGQGARRGPASPGWGGARGGGPGLGPRGTGESTGAA
jgi:hypothetical protein